VILVSTYRKPLPRKLSSSSFSLIGESFTIEWKVGSLLSICTRNRSTCILHTIISNTRKIRGGVYLGISDLLWAVYSHHYLMCFKKRFMCTCRNAWVLFISWYHRLCCHQIWYRDKRINKDSGAYLVLFTSSEKAWPDAGALLWSDYCKKSRARDVVNRILETMFNQS